MSKGKVLIAAPVHAVLIDGLKDAGYELILQEKIAQELAFSLIHECVGVITSTRLQLDKNLIDAAPMLKWIGRMGSGMEVIDVDYAAGKSIACFSSPEGNCNAVAEHALGMLLSLTKRITWSHHQVKEGAWLREENRGTELEGKTIGIIGFGHTGRAFAKKLSGFDVRILAYDKYYKENFPEGVISCEDLQPIFNEADIVSFHVPLTASTRHYFNKSFAEKMRNRFVLVNTSRGEIAETDIIFNSLKGGKLVGACLDVLEGEPLAAMSESQKKNLQALMEMPEVLVTPHIAGYSNEALFKMSQVLLAKIVNFS